MLLRWSWFLVVLVLPGLLVADDTIVINEFMAGNDAVLCDSDGNDPDWVELFNAGEREINLEGWYLTDESETLDRWRFPSVTLAPGEYLLIYMSGKNRAEDVPRAERKPAKPGDKGLHTNFRLNFRGEMLMLVGPGGTLGDVVDSVRFGRQDRDASTGRLPGRPGESGSLAKPTPGRSNDHAPAIPTGCPRPQAQEVPGP